MNGVHGVAAPPCRFCADESVARIGLSDGCIAFPDDHEQDVCLHHYRKAQPLGGSHLLRDYTYFRQLRGLSLERSRNGDAD